MRRFLILLLASGCTYSNDDLFGGGDDDDSTGAVFYGQVQPILNENCVKSCHRAGSIAPSFETYEAAAPFAGSMKVNTQQRIMPPWGPDNSGACGTFKDARWLEDAEIATITSWADGGVAAGDPALAQVVPTPPPGIAAPDATVEMVVDFTPDPTLLDEYRCFVVDGVASTQYLTAFEVVPGEKRVVHHVILFALDSAGEAAAISNDLANNGTDTRDGYECVGGAGVPNAIWTAAWAPGGGATYLPVTTGIQLNGGRKMVMQIHYNTEVAGALPDRTSIRFETAPSVAKVGSIYLLSKSSFSIPGNEPAWTESVSLNIPGTITIHGTGAHMHKYGRKQYVSFNRAGADTCLADVPRYDFNWQQVYFYEQPVTLQAGDRVDMTCTWDTSGKDAATTFGEGTEDEMCIALVYLTVGTFP